MPTFRVKVPVWAVLEVEADTKEDALKQMFEITGITIQTSWSNIETEVRLCSNAKIFADPRVWDKRYNPKVAIREVPAGAPEDF